MKGLQCTKEIAEKQLTKKMNDLKFTSPSKISCHSDPAATDSL